MLVLSRKAGEKILIDGGIEIEVVDIVGNKVKIGIVAPRDTKIVRDDAKDKEGK